jgi:hypothetical protein
MTKPHGKIDADGVGAGVAQEGLCNKTNGKYRVFALIGFKFRVKLLYLPLETLGGV